MRKALMVAGALGAVVVLAIGVVAFVAFHGSSSASTKAADVSKGTVTAKPTASAKPSPSPKAKKTKKAVKPKPSPKPSKSAKPTPTPTHSATRTSTSTSTSADPTALTVPAGWKLAFDPSFSGSSLDTGTWSTCYDESDASAGCTNNPSVENEWYLPSQVSVSGGTLNLTAKQESTQGTSATYACRSGMVTSEPSFNFTYGLIQITAKIPYGPGLWPALWLEPSNGDWPPELDIMEHWYSDQDYKVYEHYTNATDYLGGPVSTPVNLAAGYNTFSMLWTSSRVTWYLDGTQVYTTTSYVPQQAMYFIANVADRNPTDGSTALVSGGCTGTMSISSVKVWTP
jgi:beta-glucanase (GH16 family)